MNIKDLLTTKTPVSYCRYDLELLEVEQGKASLNIEDVLTTKTPVSYCRYDLELVEFEQGKASLTSRIC